MKYEFCYVDMIVKCEGSCKFICFCIIVVCGLYFFVLWLKVIFLLEVILMSINYNFLDWKLKILVCC